MHTTSNFDKKWPQGTLAVLCGYLYRSGDDCVEWAVNALMDGFESDNLSILAGLDLEPYNNTDPRDRSIYFRRVIKELGFDIFDDIKNIDTELSKIICQALLLDRIEGQKALSLLDGQFVHTGFDVDGPFLIWRELKTYLELWGDDSILFRNCDFSDYGPDELIKIVAEQYLALQAVTLPSDFYESAICNQCDFFGRLTRDKHVEFCAKCGSKNVYPMRNSFAGREKYLAAFSKE